MKNKRTTSGGQGPFAGSVLAGAGIGLAVIALLLWSAGPHPEFGKYWMLRPLLAVPFAGAVAGYFYYFTGSFRRRRGTAKVAGYLLPILAGIFLLWMGVVLGLDGTLWN